MRQLGTTLIRVLLPLVAAFVLSSLLFATSGFDIVEVWFGVFAGAITSAGASAQTLRWAIPLLVISFGIIITLRTGEFNIGAQGQLTLGGLGTVMVALLWDGPPVLVIIVAIIAGIIGGALWSAIAGWLKIRLGADEVITTLMLNFIAILLIQWVTTGPLKNDAVRGETASTPFVPEAVRLTTGVGVSTALIILVVITIVVAWIILERTPFGLKSRLTGSNPVAASWQGINVQQVRMWTYLLAGAFAGLAGAFEVLGPNGRLVTGATPTIGFTAIVVAIVGTLRVPGAVLAALFFGGLQAAILYLPIVSNLPSSGIRVMEGLVALLITAHFIRRRYHAPQIEPPPEPPAPAEAGQIQPSEATS